MATRKKNRPQFKNPVSSTDQAQATFRILFTEFTADVHIEGILHWLGKREDHCALRNFFSMPELMEDYSPEDILKGKIPLLVVCDKECRSMVKIGFLLFTLLDLIWSLVGEELYQNPSAAWPKIDPEDSNLEIISLILDTVSHGEIQQEFLHTITSIVGDSYFREFMDKLKNVGPDIRPEEIYALENDPKLKEHMQLMIWAAMMRCFIDAVYFYFGD
ncbi:hypothetical protein J2X69_002526 [Algoriphagus sp. 4150]|uniref:hypothetical protein n=1 Tax=Algoriphagus sp. 4150 TaxID=2817756 RepID=UPI002866304F|nr:hypothetical protein [Algoriphagus sp. 4150]MDR7130178.1 hypothetical protein [Algoriphagus sp. 4150]